MLLEFFDSGGIVYHEYASDGQTINREFFKILITLPVLLQVFLV